MRNTFLLTLLFLSCFSAFGQIDNYLAYQKSIHAAELHLVRGQNKEALNKYQEVLIPSEGNFVKDVYNALLVADELGETVCFFELVDLLLPKDLDQNYLNSFSVFQKWQADPRWLAFLKANQQTQAKKPKLKTTLNQLATDDQFFRVKDGSYDVYGDTIKHIDSVNMRFLLDLIANNEFPGEAMIGAQDVRGNQPLDVLFHHYCQSTSLDSKKAKITDELVQLVQTGKILPNKCGHWLEMQNSGFNAGAFDVMGFKVDGVISDWYVPVLSKEDAAVVAQTRKFLGMEPLEEYYEKIRFDLEDTGADYVFDATRSIFELDQASVELITKNMKKL